MYYASKIKRRTFKSGEDLKEQVDIIILSGGSSKGDKDYSEEVFKECGEVLIHGVAIKPGKTDDSRFRSFKRSFNVWLARQSFWQRS